MFAPWERFGAMIKHRRRLSPSQIRQEYCQGRSWFKRLSKTRSSSVFEKIAAWEARMSARVGAIEYLPELDRMLVEARNQALYSTDTPPELSDLSSWLDEQTHNRNYPNAPPGSRLNDSRYGPTVQFLFPRNRKSIQPFEAAAEALQRWANSSPPASQEGPGLELSFIREFAKTSKTLISTGDAR